MKLGVVFPQIEIHDAAAVRDYAQLAESLGYDYLLAYDHVLGANPDRPGGWTGPYTHEDSFHEPFVLFGHLAALTQRLELVTGILILPQRQTVLVAKQAAQLDFLSGGRLRLGVGIGWNQVEYTALNERFGNRGKRSEEQIALLRRLWTEPLVTFQGKYHTIEGAGLNPLPVQRPIPIWFGGSADAALRRMARLGAGWMPNPMPFDRARVMVRQLRDYLHQEGRDPAAFGLDARMNLRSTPEAGWQDYLDQWRALGATHLSINTMNAGLTTPQQHMDAIRRFMEIVGPGR